MELMFSMMLLGCSHDRKICADYSAPDQLYASRQACEEVIPLALHVPNEYPLSLAECVPAEGAGVDADERVDQLFEELEGEA